LPTNLAGWTVRDDGSDSITIEGNFTIPAGAYAVLARDGDLETNGGMAVDYVYGGPDDFFLGNSPDEVVLEDGTGIVDHVAYDPSIAIRGHSLQLSSDQLAADNDNMSLWCESNDDTLADGDFGTPGAANGMCN
jgi:hypothetical protein